MAYDHIEIGVTKKKVVKIVRKVIEDAGQDTRWFVELRNNNTFAKIGQLARASVGP
jgi:hypothetical protein